MENEKRTELVEGIVRVTRPSRDVWAMDLSTESGLKVRAWSDRPDGRDALLAIADEMQKPGPRGGEPYMLDMLSRNKAADVAPAMLASLEEMRRRVPR